MNYTVAILAILNIFGILVHNLTKMNDINRKYEGQFSLSKYWQIERFSIILSLCFGIVCLIIRTEIKELELAGKWIGLSFFAIGYMSQSLLVKFMGKAEKIVNEKTGNNE